MIRARPFSVVGDDLMKALFSRVLLSKVLLSKAVPLSLVSLGILSAGGVQAQSHIAPLPVYAQSDSWSSLRQLNLGQSSLNPPTIAQSQTFDAGARAIIVNPAVTDFRLDLGVNKRGNNPVYRIGEPITISLTPSRDAYVYLFSIESTGVVNLILPNRFAGGQNFVRSGEQRTFPAANAPYRFTIGGPRGQAQVFAVASKNPLNLDAIARFQGSEGFARAQVDRSGLGNAIGRAIIVEEVPAPDWVTSTLLYQVR
jgi:hypothetical protein